MILGRRLFYQGHRHAIPPLVIQSRASAAGVGEGRRAGSYELARAWTLPTRSTGDILTTQFPGTPSKPPLPKPQLPLPEAFAVMSRNNACFTSTGCTYGCFLYVHASSPPFLLK